MTDAAWSAEQIGSHATAVDGTKDAIASVGSDLAAAGAGNYLMYGVFCGAIAYPILSNTANGGGESVTGLEELLEAAATNLQRAADLYAGTEEVNAALGDQVAAIVDDIPVPER